MIADLKTTSLPEYEFHKRFIELNYNSQANMYTRLIQHRLKGTPFEEYDITSFFFVVVNRETLTPLLFEWNRNKEVGDFNIGKIRFKDPIKVAKELDFYLKNQVNITVPVFINKEKRNSLTELIERL